MSSTAPPPSAEGIAREIVKALRFRQGVEVSSGLRVTLGPIEAIIAAALDSASRKAREECARAMCVRCEQRVPIRVAGAVVRHIENGADVYCRAEGIWSRWFPRPAATSAARREPSCWFDLSVCLTHKGTRIADGDTCDVARREGL